MPWVNEEMCTACGICVDECPVGAMSMQNDVAHITNDECIRCGHCHDACPQEAVRHDSEKVPEDIAANLAWTKKLLAHEYFTDVEAKKGLVDRMKRHFGKEKKIAEQTVEALEKLKGEL